MGKKVTDNIVLPDETLQKLLNNEYVLQDGDILGDIVDEDLVDEMIEDEHNEADSSADENIDVENDEDNIEPENIEESKDVEYNDVDFKGRGFKTLKDAIKFLDSPVFERLGEADKEEYKKWLIK